MKPFHEELKEIRLEKGITLEQIHKETKINIAFLEKIENGDFSIVPKPFLRAFLREYAQIVGIDPNRVLLRFENKTNSILGQDTLEKKTAALRLSGPTDTVTGPGKSFQEKSAECSETGSTPLSETRPDRSPELEPDTTAPEGESSPQVQTSLKNMQPSLFEQAPKTEDKGIPDESQPFELSTAPKTVHESKLPGRASMPADRPRIDFEEPGRMNIVYIIAFILIIIAAAFIFYTTR